MASKKPEAQPGAQPTPRATTVQIQLRQGHSYPQSLETIRRGRFHQDIVLPADDVTSDEEKAEKAKLAESKGK